MSLSELVYDLQVILTTVINLEKEMNDKEFIDEMKRVIEVIEAAGGALRRLGKTQPSIGTVKGLAEITPDALSFKNEKDRLPIQSAVWNRHAVKYVPILALVGIRHNVGG